MTGNWYAYFYSHCLDLNDQSNTVVAGQCLDGLRVRYRSLNSRVPRSNPDVGRIYNNWQNYSWFGISSKTQWYLKHLILLSMYFFVTPYLISNLIEHGADKILATTSNGLYTLWITFDCLLAWQKWLPLYY